MRPGILTHDVGCWQVSEESIKENFITVYQIMDEMMDNGACKHLESEWGTCGVVGGPP